MTPGSTKEQKIFSSNNWFKWVIAHFISVFFLTVGGFSSSVLTTCGHFSASYRFPTTDIFPSWLLTVAYVSYIQVLVSANTGFSKHWVAHSDSTAVFPITAVNAMWQEWIRNQWKGNLAITFILIDRGNLARIAVVDLCWIANSRFIDYV